MEIKDTQAIYDFLGSLSWFGSVAFFALLAIIVAFVSLNISDEIFDTKSKKLKRLVTVLVMVGVIVCGVILKFEANNSRDQLRYANTIKSYLLEFKHRYKSLKLLANDVVLSDGDSLCMGDSTCIRLRIKKIKSIVREHPEEFIITAVNDFWQSRPEYNVEGLQLIDEKAIRIIDSSLFEMVPFYKSKIINYMLYNHLDTLSYLEIFDKVDGRCYENVVDMVVLSAEGQLIPINKDSPSVVLIKRPFISKTD